MQIAKGNKEALSQHSRDPEGFKMPMATTTVDFTSINDPKSSTCIKKRKELPAGAQIGPEEIKRRKINE